MVRDSVPERMPPEQSLERVQVPADANAQQQEWAWPRKVEGGRASEQLEMRPAGKGPNLVGLVDHHKAFGFSSGRERKLLEGLSRGRKWSELGM